MKNGKYTQEEIENLSDIYENLTTLVAGIVMLGFFLFFCGCGSYLHPYLFIGIAVSFLIIMFIIVFFTDLFLLLHSPKEYFERHNEKIDKEEEAKQKIIKENAIREAERKKQEAEEKAKQEAEKLRTQSQIWVNE